MIYKIFTLLACMALIVGCTDDYLLNYGPDGFPEGETEVTCQMDFEPFAVKETRGSVAPPGNGFNDIKDLVLLAYDSEGNLMEGFPLEITKSEHNLNIKDAPRTDANASNGKTDEASTLRATFRLSIPYGYYYLYGVANLGTYDNSDVTLKSTKQYLDDLLDTYTDNDDELNIRKRENFLAIRRTWDESNYRNNREMLGYFTDGAEKKSPGTNLNTNNHKIAIDRPGMTIHSWLRRCVTKVTLDFDGSALSNNIKIYVRKATIHDIPKYCALGKPNSIQSADEMITNKGTNYRPNAGHYIEYGEGSTDNENYSAWPFVSRDHPKITDTSGKVIDFHSADKKALFLYENMQGEGPADKDTGKPQQPTENGMVVGADETKDNVEFGSYIEVECYYELNSTTNVKKGNLYYRFMLGKDELKDFDVERNYHLKITMCPRGYGNDVDWHIEYIQKEGFEVKNPYYVSYLYNHDSTIRFRYTPDTGEKIVGVKAEIVGNNWWADEREYPAGAPYTQEDVINLHKSNNTTHTSLLVNANQPEAFENVNIYPSNYTDQNVGTKLRGKKKYLGNGFLSLWPNSDNNSQSGLWDVKPAHCDAATTSFAKYFYENASGFGISNQCGELLNDRYFYGLTPTNTKFTVDDVTNTFANAAGSYVKRDCSYREHDLTTSVNMGATIETDLDGSSRINIPIWTRNKNLIKQSGHTSTNPFENSTRSAYVKLTVILEKNGKRVAEKPSHSEIVRVEQVKRITNPKAVYRRSRNYEPFEVQLMTVDRYYDDDYTPLESDGPWMAEVLTSDANFININGRQVINGNGLINFTIRFNRMLRDDKVRSAIVRVRYNNYSCVHLIFVRQGYAPQVILDGGYKWRTFNMITADHEAEDPRDEGSLFKHGVMDKAIDVYSNAPLTNAYNGIAIVPSDFKKPGSKLAMARSDGKKPDADNRKYKWSDFGTGSESKFGSMTNNKGETIEVATMKQFANLYDVQCDQGFGVLYADGATKTASTTAEAFGWYRHEKAATRDAKGMRGVIVYNKQNYHNLFLPIGRSGYGNRKDNETGMLRYSTGQTSYFHTSHGKSWLWSAPLFFENFANPGAIYWAKKLVSTGMAGVDGISETGAIALDINYFTFDFNLITTGNLGKGKNACFVRCVGGS
ncbi:MAG: hypothetical protein NC201_05075 [Prevotella sp.]|nr:hypothetical protein [Bacteroides sp.]MCM1366603.1 hypothetical protein [Prevotella sp.]MCM1437300.1 hypothetical protein [Prevotella sp.]